MIFKQHELYLSVHADWPLENLLCFLVYTAFSTLKFLCCTLQEFHVTEMCFNRQNQLAAVKGKIPQMVTVILNTITPILNNYFWLMIFIFVLHIVLMGKCPLHRGLFGKKVERTILFIWICSLYLELGDTNQTSKMKYTFFKCFSVG